MLICSQLFLYKLEVGTKNARENTLLLQPHCTISSTTMGDDYITDVCNQHRTVRERDMQEKKKNTKSGFSILG